MRRWRQRRPGPVAGADEDWERKAAQIRDAAALRQAALVGQEAAGATLEELLFRHDPIGIDFGDNTDEYRAEAETVTMRRAEAHGVADVRRITHEEFVRWFGTDTAGAASRYEQVAEEIWLFWSQQPV